MKGGISPMSNRILTGDNWQERIRDKMGIDAAYLPNSAIEQPDIIQVAEANIISMVPDYEALDGDARLYLENATVLECCILLAPSMAARLPTKSIGPHARYELVINWDQKKAEFIEERNSILNKLAELKGLPSPTLPTFTVTYPKRGW